MDIDLGPSIGRLPAFETITVRGGGQERSVALLGLLTDDRALYRPGAFNGAVISDVAESADRLQQLLYQQHRVDLVIPMTHQVPVPCRTGAWSPGACPRAAPAREQHAAGQAPTKKQP